MLNEVLSPTLHQSAMSETTKVSVVLAQPANWWYWIKQIEDIALSRSIWEYINPDGDTLEPERPEHPHPSHLGAEDIAQICEMGQMDVWKEMKSEYQLDAKQYEMQRKDLIALRTAISKSIPNNFKAGLGARMPIHEMLRSICSSFKPSAQARIMELNQRF